MWSPKDCAESVPALSYLAEKKVRELVVTSLQEMKFQNAKSKKEVDDALENLSEVFGVRLRWDVHDALVRMQTIDLGASREQRPTLFRRWQSVYSLMNGTYILPHRDFSREYAPGFWAASNVLERRVRNNDAYNYNCLNGLRLTLVSLEKSGTDNQFIYDCPTVFELLLLKILPPEITERKLRYMHDRRLERRAKRYKNDQDSVGVDERLSLAQDLFVIAGPVVSHVQNVC